MKLLYDTIEEPVETVNIDNEPVNIDTIEEPVNIDNETC
jgi:hypothetical protein